MAHVDEMTKAGTPLRMEVIEQMNSAPDNRECFDLLFARHTFAEDVLFRREVSHDPNMQWNRGELAKLALMLLEGVPLKVVTDFYNYEFGKLFAKKREKGQATSHIVGTMRWSFSSDVLSAIRKAQKLKDPLLPVLVPAKFFDDPIFSGLLGEIEKYTSGLTRDDGLFTGKPFPQPSSFSPTEIVRAFYLRVSQNKNYETILHDLDRYPKSETKKRLNQLLALLRFSVNKVFTKKAREFGK